MNTPIPWLGHLIEVASLGLFGWCWAEARRLRAGLHTELLIAVLYGCLLEIMDMWIFGSYHYGPLTWWWVGHVPLYIPLLWATIIHSSMAMSDRAGLPWWARPFLDGLLAVLIDLAIDAIAIRLGLWSWRIRLDEGWFGVPAGNLCAWMWVAAWYGTVTRLVRERSVQRGEPRWHRLLIPPIAYAGLFASLIGLGTVGRWLGLETPDERLSIFAAHVAGFLAIVWWGSRRRASLAVGPTPMPPSFVWNRWLMHGSFLVLLACVPAIRQVRGLALVSAGALVIEWCAMRWCEHRRAAVTLAADRAAIG